MLALSMRHLGFFTTATVRVYGASEAILGIGGCDRRVQIYKRSAAPTAPSNYTAIGQASTSSSKGSGRGPW